MKLLNTVHAALLALAAYLIWPAFQSPPPIPEEYNLGQSFGHYMFADLGRQMYINSTAFKCIVGATILLILWILFINIDHYLKKQKNKS